MSVVEVSNLRVELTAKLVPIFEDVSFTLAPGEITGLVGESGCGKSTVAMAMMGYERRGVHLAAGSVRIDGIDILSLTESERRRMRGSSIAYVPQDPATALNPGMRLRKQLLEVLEAHDVGGSTAGRLDIVRRRLTEVNLPTDDHFLDRYPHQISGGQQQRVAIAIAFACLPKVLVCDEPTTGLDVSTQGYVLDTIQQLARDYGVATVYVSHDLAVVAQISKSIKVMYSGQIIEAAPVPSAFLHPRHPYTSALISAIPNLDDKSALVSIPGNAPRPTDRGAGCLFATRCSRADERCHDEAPPTTADPPDHMVRCYYPLTEPAAPPERTVGKGGAAAVASTPVLEARDVVFQYGARTVLRGVSLAIQPGTCLALVGESGSGKTTISRALAGLVAPDSGRVLIFGKPAGALARQRSVEQRKQLQIIFQNPYASLNPRRTIGNSVASPVRFLLGASRGDARDLAAEALRLVALNPVLQDAYPDQLSGGERQRAAIARALICDPDILICDEITSALDVSIQASIVNLLIRLKEERGLALIFVTHNLPLVSSLAEETMVLWNGSVVEHGPTSAVLRNPQHGYTRSLLADTPQLRPETANTPS